MNARYYWYQDIKNILNNYNRIIPNDAPQYKRLSYCVNNIKSILPLFPNGEVAQDAIILFLDGATVQEIANELHTTPKNISAAVSLFVNMVGILWGF